MKKSYLDVIAAVFVLALVIPFALSSITDLFLVSPSDNAWTNNTTPDFNFTAATTRSSGSCELFINDTGHGSVPISDVIQTYTITANNSLTNGPYNWYINCTDTDETKKSLIRTINIDITAPSVTLIKPSNNTETTAHKIDFEFKATDNLASDLSCKLYVDGSEEDSETAQNNTDDKFDNIDVDSGNHTWYVKCADSVGNTGQSETRNLNVKSYCDYGECGDIKIDRVYEPDSDDDFYPGDNITVKVKIKNKADEELDIIVGAELYDIDDDDYIVNDEETTTISKNDYDTITLTLDVPYNIDESHDFVVRVKAYEDDAEDAHCDEDSISVNIKRAKHAVSIESLEFDQTTVACGGVASLNLEIANTGKNNEDVKIEINSAFFNWTKSKFDLDKGDDYKVKVPVIVPQDGTEGTYTINVKVYYHYSNVYHDFASDSKTLTIKGNCPPEPAPDASFSASQISDAFTGQSFRIKIAIANTGNVKTNYTISASGYEEWATLNKIEPSTLTLNAGKTGYAYISLKPDANATGSNSFTIAVSFDSTSKEQTVNVEVKKESTTAGFLDRFIFEWNRNWYWFALIVLLVVVIIILIIVLAKQSARHVRYLKPTEIRLRTAQQQIEKLEKKLGKGKDKRK